MIRASHVEFISSPCALDYCAGLRLGGRLTRQVTGEAALKALSGEGAASGGETLLPLWVLFGGAGARAIRVQDLLGSAGKKLLD